MNTEKLNTLVEELGDINDDLLAILDDLWLEIDHTNPDSIRTGSEKMIAVVESVRDFHVLKERICTQLQGFLPLTAETEPPQPIVNDAPAAHADPFDGRTRVGFQCSWSYKRPYGFRLRSVSYERKLTWIELYISLCEVLRSLDPSLFDSIPDRPELVSTHGNPYFARERSLLRSAQEITPRVYAETNLSAKLIRNNIARLCLLFSIGESEIEIYLRKP